MKTDEFTTLLYDKLKSIFPPELIIPEWRASKDSEDDFNNIEYYAPRVDVAIGPFNINRQIQENNLTFHHFATQHRELLLRLFNISHLAESSSYSFEGFMESLNINPRCFIAVEIENTKDGKRAIGDILNASVMGKIGVVVPIGQDKYRMFEKIKKYFNYLKDVQKLPEDFNNVLIIEGGNL